MNSFRYEGKLGVATLLAVLVGNPVAFGGTALSAIGASALKSPDFADFKNECLTKNGLFDYVAWRDTTLIQACSGVEKATEYRTSLELVQARRSLLFSRYASIATLPGTDRTYIVNASAVRKYQADFSATPPTLSISFSEDQIVIPFENVRELRNNRDYFENIYFSAKFSPLSYSGSRIVSPGSSIQAAIDSARAGEVVMVSPGAYRQNIRLKNKVDLYFHEGAIIESPNGPFLIQTTSVVESRILGFGVFKNMNAQYGVGVIHVSNASKVYFQFKETLTNTPFTTYNTAGHLWMKGQRMTALGGNNYDTDWYLLLNDLDVQEMNSVSGEYPAVNGPDASFYVRNAQINGPSFQIESFPETARMNLHFVNAVFNNHSPDGYSGSNLSKQSGEDYNFLIYLNDVMMYSNHPDAMSIDSMDAQLNVWCFNECIANRMSSPNVLFQGIGTGFRDLVVDGDLNL